MAITFPVGFLFRPTDKEIIQHYLLKKQMGVELPLNGVIQEGDVFSEEVLSEVFRSSETHVYFFTQLKKKSVKGSNHDRTVGKATWRCESVTDICFNEKTVIGKKRILDYINPGSIGHRDWNMKEFSLDGVLLEHPQTSSDYVVCLLEKKERAIKRDRQKNRQTERNAGGALDCDLPINKRMRVCGEHNQRLEQYLMKSTATTFPHGLHENEIVTNTLAMPSPAYTLPVTVIESTPISQQVAPIHGEAGFESMVNVVATDTLAKLPPSASYDLSECTSMPPLVPAKTVDEEGGCTSGEQENRMLPVEKSHWEYQQSIAGPESLAIDAIRDSISLLSATVEGFAEDFIYPFLDGNEVVDDKLSS
ncbi:NAC transcription factor 29-like [Actinidia eriantha]|uniref:NAC transcription factor 29-like n=1 Tax=Actinidia eriantha TaxID=165200 RepID=UPI00258D5EBA|nr:NAC transcription factor 29-like [Actinidia eriantha]